MSGSYVSVLYIVASSLTILGLLQMPGILTRLGNRKTSLLLSVVGFFSLIGLALGTNTIVITGSFIVFFVSSNFLFASLDIFVKDLSQETSIGKSRGLYLMILNLAWVVSQAISGSVVTKSSFKGLYLLGACFMALVVIIFVKSLHNFIDPKYKKVAILDTFKVFVKNKNISKIYLVNFILKFFYVWMIIYTPIYLHEHIGFHWDAIGLIFTVMLLPFVALTYSLGKLSDKIGEKEFLTLGFIFIAVSTMLIPFITEPSLLIWAGILFATRVGAATIEIMSESYFFKNVSKEDPDIISFFRNTSPLAFILAPLIAIPVFIFTPSFEHIFFVLGAILLTGLYVTLRIKDTL